MSKRPRNLSTPERLKRQKKITILPPDPNLKVEELVVVPHFTTCEEIIGWKGKKGNKEIECGKLGTTRIQCGWGVSMTLCNECYTKKLDTGYFAYSATPLTIEDSN